MVPTMAATPTFSESERRLILELLERERTQLPGEIHHTAARAFREGLRTRMQLVETLILKLNSPAP